WLARRPISAKRLIFSWVTRTASRSAWDLARAINAAVSRSSRSVFQRFVGAATIRERRSSIADKSCDKSPVGCVADCCELVGATPGCAGWAAGDAVEVELAAAVVVVAAVLLDTFAVADVPGSVGFATGRSGGGAPASVVVAAAEETGAVPDA